MTTQAALVAAACAAMLWTSGEAAQDIRDVERLVRMAPNRAMGSPYRQVIDDYVAQRFKATGLECGEITFPTAVYVPGKAEIQLPDGRVLPLYGVAPNSAHPGNLPKAAWRGRLVRFAKDVEQQTSGVSLSGAAALLDMDSHRRWVAALELGAEVLIFSGLERMTGRQGMKKICKAPLAVPRFYVTPADGLTLRKALAHGGSLTVTITEKAPARWQHAVARINWVIVPGTTHADKVVHLQTYKDADSFVPALAPGAEAAANLALLLRLLDYYTDHKPQCTLVLSAVSDHCNLLRGEQFYLGFAVPEERALNKEIEQRQKELREARFYTKVYADRTAKQIERLREGTSDETGRSLRLKAPLSRELEYRCNRLRHRKLLLTQRKRRPRNDEDLAAVTAELAALETDLRDVIAVTGVLRRYGAQSTVAGLSQQRQEYLLAAMKKMETRFAQQVADSEAALAEIEANGRLRRQLAGKPPLLYLSLDVSFGHEQMGLFFIGGAVRASSQGGVRMVPMARLSLDVARRLHGGDRYFTDTILKTGGVMWRNHLGGSFAMAATFGGNAEVPSLTLTTTGDTRDLRFTPDDTLEHVDRDRMAGMLDFSRRLVTAFLDDKDFPATARPVKVRRYGCLTYRYGLRLIDPYSVDIPTEPVRDAVAVAWVRTQTKDPVVGQVSLCQRTLTNRSGSVIFRAARIPLAMESFVFDPGYRRIVAATDAGSGARRLDPAVKRRGSTWSWYDPIALLFECVQTDLVGLYDPATREAVYSINMEVPDTIILLDALRESSPDHYGIAGIWETRSIFKPALANDGVACIFSEKGVPIKVIADKLLLINASKDRPDGAGFLPGDSGLRSISVTGARDLQTLNRARMDRILAKGVANPGAQKLFAKAQALMNEADAAQRQGRQRQALVKSVQGLSSALRSYGMVRSATMDLIKAVAVFLALVIPFCMFLMKLITPWTDIRAQIASFLGLFAVMATALALLHPAFSLSQTPMMVLLAFVMVGLAVFVMVILYGRFDTGLQRLVEEAQGVESTESSQKTLIGVAFSVGVNNMRRRRIRTTLTSLTVVLVTFTMLSVISVTQDLSPYRRRTEDRAPYNGVLFAKAGMAPIQDSEMEHVLSLFAPYGAVARRTWTQRLDQWGGYMSFRVRNALHPEKVLHTKSLLGLETAERGLIADLPLAAGRWFQANDARERILSVAAASYLGITPETFTPSTLLLRNEEVLLVGLIEDARLAELEDLTRLPLLPLESVPDPVRRSVSEDGRLAVQPEDAKEGPAPKAQGIRPHDCAIVPTRFALSLPDTSYRSIALKTPDAPTAWRAAGHFADATAVLTYTGLTGRVELDDGSVVNPGQYSLAPPVGANVGGVSRVLIPICLAATIILNTMLGSVMERKKEISIYNSIGLNPTHVFVFFVAEALVFGLVGAVAGYLIGQGLGQAIVAFGWLPGINLNYSSMAVMLVILGAIVTVIVSTLYPAYLATQASVPSGQRRWKLPAPAGDEIHLDFPFSYTEDQLVGVCAFLHAFMDMNSEASSGQFLAQDARFGFVRDAEGRKVIAMVYGITPVPFDLGVNQKLEIYAYYQPKVRAYVLGAYLQRLKGDRTSWLVVNQPFMESLRGRLLGWRSQSAAHQEKFRQQGEAMFENASEFAVREAGA